MENKELQILAEMSELAASVRRQLEELEEKIGQLKAVYEESSDYQIDINDIPIDIDIDDIPAEEPEKVVDVIESEPVAEVVGNVAEAGVEEEDAVEEIEESVFEPVHESVVETIVEAAPVRQAVIDVMEDKRAWKTDMPGASVRDIRSAISLNDRVLFINRLFNEDPMSFQDMLSRINNMTSLDEVVEAVVAEHPEWDLGSEIVYRFMMAVRRKVR